MEPVDTSRLAESLASACGQALSKHLDNLKEAHLTRIGLRVNISADNVRTKNRMGREKLEIEEDGREMGGNREKERGVGSGKEGKGNVAL